MKGKYIFLRSLLGMIGGSHVLLGAAILSGRKGMERAATSAYGATVPLDGQLVYIVRLAGPYVLGAGILQLLAMINPHRYKHVIDVTLLYYLFNNLTRLTHRHDAYAAFGIKPARLWVRFGFFTTMGLLTLRERILLERNGGQN